MGIGEWSTTTHVPRNVSRNVYALLLQWEGGGTHDHVGKWLQLFQLWDHTDLQHVKVDTPCDGPLIKEKRAYQHIMHEQTPQLSLLTIINVLTSHIQVFNTPHLNIMAVNMPRQLDSGTFIRE
jgi:hypothetical protein